MPHYDGTDYDNLDDPALDLTDALNTHNRRSNQAREVDERRQAEMTDDVDEWKEDPGEYDFHGVDQDEGLWD